MREATTRDGTPAQPAPLSDREAELLVHRAGATPVYAYSRAALQASVARVRDASVRGALLYYSLKANPHPGVVTHLATLVDGLDVCSLGELETALNTGMPPERILFTGPAKSEHEAAASLAAGIAVTIESPRQAELFARTADGLGVAGQATLRLNAPYPGKHLHDPPSPNHFGAADDDLAEVVAVLRRSRVAITGLHLFWGSQYFDPAVITAARRAALARARAVAERCDLALRTVAIGGGIGMPWCADDPAVDWAALHAASTDPELVAGCGAARIVCEYGRSVVGPAGTLLTRVLDTKRVDGRRYVLVDAGMNHVQIASRLVAGGVRGEPAVRAVGRPASDADGPAYVTGPLCSQLDVLAAGVPLPDVEVGDLLAFDGVGAYGPSFSPTGFLSREPAREVVY